MSTLTVSFPDWPINWCQIRAHGIRGITGRLLAGLGSSFPSSPFTLPLVDPILDVQQLTVYNALYDPLAATPGPITFKWGSQSTIEQYSFDNAGSHFGYAFQYYPVRTHDQFGMSWTPATRPIAWGWRVVEAPSPPTIYFISESPIATTSVTIDIDSYSFPDFLFVYVIYNGTRTADVTKYMQVVPVITGLESIIWESCDPGGTPPFNLGGVALDSTGTPTRATDPNVTTGTWRVFKPVLTTSTEPDFLAHVTKKEHHGHH